MEHDPFERAVAREMDLRLERERARELSRWQTVSSLQGFVVFAAALPLHLLAVDWSLTAGMWVHLVLLTILAMATVQHWIDARSGRRATAEEL